MDQEAANELPAIKCHRLLTIAIPVVFPVEADLAVIHGDQPVVGDGNTVRIAADIVEELALVRQKAASRRPPTWRHEPV